MGATTKKKILHENIILNTSIQCFLPFLFSIDLHTRRIFWKQCSFLPFPSLRESLGVSPLCSRCLNFSFPNIAKESIVLLHFPMKKCKCSDLQWKHSNQKTTYNSAILSGWGAILADASTNIRADRVRILSWWTSACI